MKLWMKWIMLGSSLMLLLGCSPKSGSVTTISLDYPHGGLRLLIRRDGETQLFYGALPESQRIAEDLFDIDLLFEQLQSRIEREPSSGGVLESLSYGMVTYGYRDGSSEDFFISDGDYARQLFTTACENRVLSGDSYEEFFERLCVDEMRSE